MPNELNLARSSRAPVTRGGRAADLSRLGVRTGSVPLVHSSLSAIGWVYGRAQAVIEPLSALGELPLGVAVQVGAGASRGR